MDESSYEVIKPNVETTSQSEVMEIALFDALHYVFKFLNLKQLCRASLVCKFWHDVAKIEMASRCTLRPLALKLFIPERNLCNMQKFTLIMRFLSRPRDNRLDIESIKNILSGAPFILDGNDSDFQFNCLKDDAHVQNRLRFIPKFCLIFADYSPEPAIYTKVIEKYSEILPDDCEIALIVADSVFIEDYLLESEKNLGLGFFFPRQIMPKFDIKTYTMNYEDIEKSFTMTTSHSNLAKDIINQLITDDDNHNCLLIFKSEDLISKTASYKNFEESLISSLKEKYKPGKLSLWGGCFREIYTKSSQYSKLFAELHGEDEPKCLFVRLSGKSLKSWTISIENSLSLEEKRQKLLQFREKIELKKNFSMVLVINTTLSIDTNGILDDIFNEIFIFQFQAFSTTLMQYIIDSSDSTEIPEIKVKNSILFMVITHS